MKQQTATVCIVDDDEAVRGSLKLLLKSLGVPALVYGSAQEFLADFDPQRSGCLVLDIRMPGMSGLELQGFGQINIETALRLTRPANGALGFGGATRVQMLRLDNGFLRGIGGGLPTVTANIALGAGGRLDLRNLRFTAPLLTLAGEGYRTRDGVIHLKGSGTHQSYGPLDLVLHRRGVRVPPDVPSQLVDLGFQLAAHLRDLRRVQGPKLREATPNREHAENDQAAAATAEPIRRACFQREGGAGGATAGTCAGIAGAGSGCSGAG